MTKGIVHLQHTPQRRELLRNGEKAIRSSKCRSVVNVTPVRGFLAGSPLAQADLKTLPLGTMPQLRQAGIRDGGVRLAATIRKALKT